ncbi:hypothetical protein KUTeg_023283 [Tegillarca granosa]|uniref:Uncharacterized protein n=1 Tax=Tegillarca granosa TaxID=220873 RepID=A0ABQ9E195_TEGGR|nr:hypothetical protein KUTeg_023283 [Tegillarca granosa]
MIIKLVLLIDYWRLYDNMKSHIDKISICLWDFGGCIYKIQKRMYIIYICVTSISIDIQYDRFQITINKLNSKRVILTGFCLLFIHASNSTTKYDL